MAVFENPLNGYREEVTAMSGFWAFLFGVFYFMYKGLWQHVIIQIIVGVLLVSIGSSGAAILSLFWIGYAVAAPGIISNKYRRIGWQEVGPVYAGSPKTIQQVHHVHHVYDEKICPQCAETIKAAASVCRFCGFRFLPQIIDVEPSEKVRSLSVRTFRKL